MDNSRSKKVSVVETPSSSLESHEEIPLSSLAEGIEKGEVTKESEVTKETLDCHGKTGMDLVRASRAYLGVPYHHAGRSKEGIDCGGLVIQAIHDCGIDTSWDTVNYSAVLDCERIQQCCDRFCDRIPIEDRQPGDVGIFVMGKLPQHIGIFTDIGIIHTFTSMMKVVESTIGSGWLRHLEIVYRLRGLSNG